MFTSWLGEVGVLYATGVMTVMVVIFAEVLPKTIAINAPDRVSLLVARPMKLMVYLLAPALAVIEAIVRALMNLLGIKIGANQPVLSPNERLRGAVDLLHHEGKVEKQDRDMFGGLLDLRELQVSDVMVHRTEMVMINADLPPEELKGIPTVCGSLREALENLDKNRGFLKNGGVFDDDFIDAYIELKMTEVERFEMTPHPVEFDMYYSL